MKRIKNVLSLAVALILLTPLYASAAADKVYLDVPAEHWAEEAIHQAGTAGLMNGFDDGTFGLGKSLSRAEFVTILSRMFAWTALPEAPAFSDVSPSDWYYTAVQQAAAAAVTDGAATFRPLDAITRQDMAQMLVSALGYDQLAAGDWSTPFSDVSGPGAGYLAVAYDIGMVNGSESFGRLLFRPLDTATREEAAAMLVRVNGRYTTPIRWLHGFYAFSSYSQIDLTAAMDGVSVGWAKLELGADGIPFLNDKKSPGNDWVKPTDSSLATDVFASNNTPVNLNIYGSDTACFFTPQARVSTIAAIVATSVDYAGITIDIEGFKGPENRVAFTTLMTELRAALPANKTLYVCVQPDTWYDGFDYRALGRLCDKVILMAHDYQWTSVPAGYVGTEKTNTPVTPISEIYRALRSITHPETGVEDRSKLALAISFANVGLQVDENNLLAGTQIVRPAIATVYTRLTQPNTEMGWSDVYLNPYLFYTTEDGTRYRLWYEDARSVAAKVQLARMFDIHGISLWRIGSIPNYPGEALHFNVWDTLLSLR